MAGDRVGAATRRGGYSNEHACRTARALEPGSGVIARRIEEAEGRRPSLDLGSLAYYSAEPGTRREPTVTGAARLGQGDRNRLIGRCRMRRPPEGRVEGTTAPPMRRPRPVETPKGPIRANPGRAGRNRGREWPGGGCYRGGGHRAGHVRGPTGGHGAPFPSGPERCMRPRPVSRPIRERSDLPRG